MIHAPEQVMARRAAAVGAVLLGPAALVAGTWRGWGGALTAAGGVALVVVWFVASALPLAWAARYGPVTTGAVALIGYALRVAGLGLVAVAVEPVPPLDPPVLAATVVVAMVALLAAEVRLALTRAELWWVRTEGRERA